MNLANRDFDGVRVPVLVESVGFCLVYGLIIVYVHVYMVGDLSWL